MHSLNPKIKVKAEADGYESKLTIYEELRIPNWTVLMTEMELVGKWSRLENWTNWEIRQKEKIILSPLSFMIAHFDAYNQKLCTLGLTKNNLRFDVVSGQAW